MSGTPVKNFKMFRKLCGDSALRNVVIVTNMWGEVKPQVGEAREAELMGKIFSSSPPSRRVHRWLVTRTPFPRPNTSSVSSSIVTPTTAHPEELVDEGKDITQTRAGQELNRELADQIRKHKEEISAYSRKRCSRR
jgi:hypothetical protein